MQHDGDLPALTCFRATTPPTLSGRVDDPVWERAQRTDAFCLLRREPNAEAVRPTFATMVRALWDDRYLYIAFECETPDVWATKTKRDDMLWDDPVVEVFLDVSGEGKSFFEFQVNPLGTIYDSYVADARDNENWRHWCRWDCQGLRVAAFVDGKLNDRGHRDAGWSAELAIPFDDLVAQTGTSANVGDIWRANFTRYERAAELPALELITWAPVVGVFDDLPRFGSLRFAP